MNGFKREQSSPEGAAEAHRPVREFFKAHLVGLPGKAKEKAKKDYQLVKQAFILRNTDGKEEIRTTVKLPAAVIIANVGEWLGVVIATTLASVLTDWSNEIKTLAGGLVGDYIGSSLAFGLAWYAFNLKRFSEPTFKEGLRQFFREWGAAFWNSLGGAADILGGKLKAAIAGKDGIQKTLLKLAKPAVFAFGIAISPVAASYYIYSAMMFAYSSLGVPPVIAALAGGIGIGAFFTIYSAKLFMPFIRKIDAGREMKADS